jgi:transcriptional regulator with XRE-family HTH domain
MKRHSTHRRTRDMRLISAERLALLMREKNFGPSRMARYCEHKSHSYISRMLRGLPGTRTVTEKTARLIAEALGVPVGVLFEDPVVKSVDSTQSAA